MSEHDHCDEGPCEGCGCDPANCTCESTIKALALECRRAVGMTYVGDELIIEEYMRKAIDAHEGFLIAEVGRLREFIERAIEHLPEHVLPHHSCSQCRLRKDMIALIAEG